MFKFLLGLVILGIIVALLGWNGDSQQAMFIGGLSLLAGAAGLDRMLRFV
ncbi:MAG: hypothetical protein ACLGJC_25390 [Alphaproteobacteria bacterium]